VVGLLIRLRGSIEAHTPPRRRGWLVAAGVLGLLAAVSTLGLGLGLGLGREGTVPGAATDTIAFVLALWVAGQVGQAALSGGDPVLPPELLALLPIPRRTLATALILVTLRSPGTWITGIALAAVIGHAAREGLLPLLVGAIGWALTLALTIAAATLAGAAVAPSARRGRDLATGVIALVLSAVALAGTLLPLLAGVLDHRSSPALSAVVRALPSGWAPVAVDAAARGDGVVAGLALAGLAAATLVALAVLPAALARRIAGAAAPRRGHGRGRRRRAAPVLTSPTGAVVAKELRLWVRDPLRLTCLLIALLVSAGTALLPATTSATTALLPFGGLLWTVITAACASNLHGQDGTTTWSTLLTPHSAGPDLHGRQLAWLVVTAPVAVVAGVVGTAVSGHPWAWPWVAALTPALLLGGAGVLIYASVRVPLPLDATGGPTPAISVKVQVCLYMTALTAAPTAAVLVLGTVTGDEFLDWAAVPAALAVGTVLLVALTRGALRAREPCRRAPLTPS
jgi:ABC-2 type transport system permease protein